MSSIGISTNAIELVFKITTIEEAYKFFTPSPLICKIFWINII